jgi:hypothetical protein
MPARAVPVTMRHAEIKILVLPAQENGLSANRFDRYLDFSLFPKSDPKDAQSAVRNGYLGVTGYVRLLAEIVFARSAEGLEL